MSDTYTAAGATLEEPTLLDAVLPFDCALSRICRRGTLLTLTDLDGGANVSTLLYLAADPLERYCMPDTLKAQHVGRLTAGVALHSDMGRVLASIVADTCGWHDTIGGHLSDEVLANGWGEQSYAEARNGWRRSARALLLVELAKHGLSRRDLVANINFFSKLAIDDDDDALSYVEGHSAAGAQVAIRFELDTLVVLANAPHPLAPKGNWGGSRVRLTLTRTEAPAGDDPVRKACRENERAFQASEATLR